MTNLPRRALGVTAALLGVGILASTYVVRAADSPLLRGDLQRSGVAGEPLTPPLSLLWRFTASPLRNNSSAPAIVGDTVYFATGATQNGGGVLYALDAKTGAQKWRYPSQGGVAGAVFQTAPLVEGGLVYIGASDGNMYIVDATSGELSRTFKTGGSILSSPAISSGVLLFGSNDDILHALDAKAYTGVWRQQYRTGDNVNSAPVIADGMVFVTSADQHIHAINLATGIGRWRFRLPFTALVNGPVFSENTLYVPAGPRLHAFAPRAGNLRWQQNLPNNIAVPPVAQGGIVYVADRDRNLYALRSNNGREAWEKPVALPFMPAAAPTISGNVLYIPSDRNMIYALSREDGRILWDYAIKPSTNDVDARPAPFTSVSAPLAIANGTLYALSDDGSLSAFRTDAPDSTPPLATKLFPRPGSQVSGAPPLVFAAELDDPGSGFDRESVKLRLDEQEVVATFDPGRNLVYYRTGAQTNAASNNLTNGRHTVTLTARDWRGNVREETWSFSVDNSLPAAVNQSPATPAAPRQPRVRPTTPPGGQRPGGRRPGGGRPDRPRPGRPNTPPAPPL